MRTKIKIISYAISREDFKDPKVFDPLLKTLKDEDVENDEMLDMVEGMDYPEFKKWAKKEDPTMTDPEIQQAYLYLKQKAKMRHKDE